MAQRMLLGQYNVEWNSFQSNLVDNNKKLFDKKLFADVTLVSDDFIPIEAHKTILSGASELFKKLLVMNLNAKPWIYLRGVKFQELQAILEFIYTGETKIYENNIEIFIKTFKEFEIKGLKICTKDDNSVKAKFYGEKMESIEKSKKLPLFAQPNHKETEGNKKLSSNIIEDSQKSSLFAPKNQIGTGGNKNTLSNNSKHVRERQDSWKNFDAPLARNYIQHIIKARELRNQSKLDCIAYNKKPIEKSIKKNAGSKVVLSETSRKPEMNAEMKILQDLSGIIKANKGSQISRQCVKNLWKYLKENNVQQI